MGRELTSAVDVVGCELGRGPGASLGWAAQELGDTQEMFATVFCAIVDPQAGFVHYASAGHPDGVLLHPTGPLLDATDADDGDRVNSQALLPPTGPLLSSPVATWAWGGTEELDLLRAGRGPQSRRRAGPRRTAAPAPRDPDGRGRAAADEERRRHAVRRHRRRCRVRRVALDSTLEQVRSHTRERFTDDCTLLACLRL